MRMLGRFVAPVAGLLPAFLLATCASSTTSTSGTPRPLGYVALGASDAVGIGAFPPTLGYVYLIANDMMADNFTTTLSNLGIDGAKADQILSDELPAAIAAAPDVVTLWTGSNDVIGARSPEAFGEQLDSILGKLRTQTRAQVFVADLVDLTQAPLFQVRPDSDVTRARIDAFNAKIDAVAAAHGAIVIRLSEMPLDVSLFSIDGFHPSNEGHRQIAQRFWAEIQPRL